MKVNKRAIEIGIIVVLVVIGVMLPTADRIILFNVMFWDILKLIPLGVFIWLLLDKKSRKIGIVLTIIYIPIAAIYAFPNLIKGVQDMHDYHNNKYSVDTYKVLKIQRGGRKNRDVLYIQGKNLKDSSVAEFTAYYGENSNIQIGENYKIYYLPNTKYMINKEFTEK